MASRKNSVKNNYTLDEGEFFMVRSAFVKIFKEEHAAKPEYPDSEDAEVNRKVGEIKPDKASIFDGFFAICAIGTFIADIATDALVAMQHFQNGHTIWFALTCFFIIFPSLIMQTFSCKWFREDYLNQTWWTYLLHVFQLGTIERYMLAFWYGIRTRYIKPVQHSDYIRYLTEWRDITLLRLFEGFLEAAPQMILQLYILASQQEFIVDRDWLTATSAVMSIISLSWAIVSYSQMLRLCLNNQALSIFGYCFQIFYRILMVASRVAVLVLFASAFDGYIFVFVSIHVIGMFGWLTYRDAVYYSSQNEDRDEPFANKVFTFIVSVIYLFCFLNIHPLTTKKEISVYYSIMFLESAILMSLWFPYRTIHGVLMYASFSLVFGGFILGLVFMLLYYKFFHPRQDVTAGWLCCPWFSKSATDMSEIENPILKDISFSYDDNDKDIVIVNAKERSLKRSPTPTTPKSENGRLSIPVELVRPHSPSKAQRHSNSIELSDLREEKPNSTQYGAIHSPGSKGRRKRYKNTLSDSAIEKVSTHQSPEKLNLGSLKGFNSENNKKSGWKVRISKSKLKHTGDLQDENEVLKNKKVLAEIKLGVKLPSKEEESVAVKGNSVNIETSVHRPKEQRPLIYRQGSKDDSHLANDRILRTEDRTLRPRSLSYKGDIRVCLSDWVREQIVERDRERTEIEKRYSKYTGINGNSNVANA